MSNQDPLGILGKKPEEQPAPAAAGPKPAASTADPLGILGTSAPAAGAPTAGAAKPASKMPDPVTSDELVAFRDRIAKTDPQLKPAADKAVKATPDTLLGKVFSTIDAPRKFVANHLLDGHDTYGEWLESKNPSENRTGVGKWAGRVAGFLGDVLMDPLTYVTAGAGAAGKSAAKAGAEAVLREGAEVAAKKAAGEVVEAGAKKAAVKVAQRFTPEEIEAARDLYLSGKTQAGALKDLHKAGFSDIVKQFPKEAQGGVRFRVPGATSIAGREVSVPLIPGKLTTQVAAPLSEATRKVKPLQNALNSVSKLRQMEVSGRKGYEFAKVIRESGDFAHTMQHTSQQVLKDTQKQFSDEASKGDLLRFLDEGVEAPHWTPDQAAQAQKVRDYLDESYRIGTEKAGMDIRYGNTYHPRSLTDEALEKMRGADAGARSGQAAIAPQARARRFADMPLHEANEALRAELGLEEGVNAFVMDPIEALARHGTDYPNRVRSAFLEKTGVDMGILEPSMGRTASGIWESDLRAAGKAADIPDASPRQVLDAALDDLEKGDTKWLDNIPERSRQPLLEELERRKQFRAGAGKPQFLDNKRIQTIARQVEKEGGATYDPWLGKFVNKNQHGYVYSAVPEGQEFTIPADQFNEEGLRGAIDHFNDLFGGENATDYRLGIWHDKGRNVYEVTPSVHDASLIRTQDEGMRLGQRMYWDVNKADAFPVGGEKFGIHGPERERFRKQVQNLVGGTEVDPADVDQAVALYDAMARGSVRAGKFDSVDEAYKSVTAQQGQASLAKAILDNKSRGVWYQQNAMRRVFGFRPNDLKEMRQIVRNNEDLARWYSNVGDAVRKRAVGMPPVRLANGAEIEAEELYINILAATSLQTSSATKNLTSGNIERANAIIKRYRETGDIDQALNAVGGNTGVHGLYPSHKPAIRDILEGNTIDKWVDLGKGGPRELTGKADKRIKVWNFYHNLKGSPDHVTIDLQMFDLFDLPRTNENYRLIADTMRDISAKTKGQFSPSEVQAALWGFGKKQKGQGEGNLAEAFLQRYYKAAGEALDPPNRLASTRTRAASQALADGSNTRQVGHLEDAAFITPDGKKWAGHGAVDELDDYMDEGLGELDRLMAREMASTHEEIAEAAGTTLDDLLDDGTMRAFAVGDTAYIHVNNHPTDAQLRSIGDIREYGAVQLDVGKYSPTQLDKTGVHSVTIYDPNPLKVRQAIENVLGPRAAPLLQKFQDDLLGAIHFGEDYTAAIHIFRDGNLGTLAHEGAHLMRRWLPDADIKQVEKVFRITDGQWDEAAEERFARAFENYLAKGESPNPALDSAFGRLKETLREMWETLRNKQNIDKRLKAVFDDMLRPVNAEELAEAGIQQSPISLLKGTQTQIDRGNALSLLQKRMAEGSSAAMGRDPFIKGMADWPAPEFKAGAVPPDWAQIDQTLSLGPLKGMYAPRGVAAELNESFAPKALPKFMQSLENFNKHFKFLVTVPWPGFHARNFYGALFNNMLGGVGTADYTLFAKAMRAGDEFLPQLGMTGHEFKALLEPLTGDISQLAEMAGKLGGKTDKLYQAIGKYSLGNALMTNIEKLHRGAAYVSGLRRFKDPYAARMFALVRHGDYTELTHTERALRSIIPFYKWMRTNLPYQFQSLLEQPGRAMMPYKATRAFEGPQERQQFEEEGNFFSPLQSQANAFLNPLASKPAITQLDLPLYDVNQYFNPGPGNIPVPNPKAFLASGHPLIKALTEAATKERLYGSGPIKQWAPAQALYKPIALLIEKTPLGPGLVQRGRGGELLISSSLRGVLDVLPTSRAASTVGQFFPPAGQEGNSGGNIALEALSGIKNRPVTEDSQAIQAWTRNKELEALRTELFRRGLGDQWDATKQQKTTAAGPAAANDPLGILGG